MMGALVVCGRMLVPILLAADDELSRAVPASLPGEDESLTSAVPSERQKTSASSFSMRLHWGQRFIRDYSGKFSCLIKALNRGSERNSSNSGSTARLPAPYRAQRRLPRASAAPAFALPATGVALSPLELQKRSSRIPIREAQFTDYLEKSRIGPKLSIL